MIDAKAHGAVGDGRTDDTAALQAALDAAGAVGGELHLPPGNYLTTTLRVPPGVTFVGEGGWSYRTAGASVLRLRDGDAKCLLDLSGATAATLRGLSLDGGELGDSVHGILLDHAEYSRAEDTVRIEGCRCAHFSGDGIRLRRVFVFYVRASMCLHNRGHGLWVRGWDGFVIDSSFSGNHGAGYCAVEENASVTLTANRIEWNRQGGIEVAGGTHYNITGNYIDRSGGPGIRLRPRADLSPTVFTITGNVIFRSGKPDWTAAQPAFLSAHLLAEAVHGLVFTGNTMNVGQDDRGKGGWSPRYGLVCGGLESSVISANVLHRGAIEELIHDLGGHGDGVVIADNPGSLYDPATMRPGLVNAVLADPEWEA